MNIVGKTLIVLQLFLSLLFVCFAGAVYHFQGQWQQKAVQLEEENGRLEQNLDDQLTTSQAEITAAETARGEAEDALLRVQNELTAAQEQAETDRSRLADVIQERDKAIAENERSTDEAASRLAEAKVLRLEVQALREQIAIQLEEIRAKDNENLDNSGRLVEARLADERNLKLIARLRNLLRANGIDPSTRLAGDVPEPVEKVDGYVLARRRNRSRTQEFVQASIGSDDYIRKDTILTVYRDDKYICEVRIIDVASDSSTGIVIEQTRNGTVQEGDNVTTKL